MNRSLLICFLIAFTSTQNVPSFTNPIRTGTDTVTFTFITDPTPYDGICYNAGGTIDNLGTCTKNNLVITCNGITNLRLTDFPLYSCVKGTPTTNTDLKVTLMIRDQVLVGVAAGSPVSFGVVAPIIINFQEDVQNSDIPNIKYKFRIPDEKTFTSCEVVAENQKQVSCSGTFGVAGIYSILYDSKDTSQAFVVQGMFI